MGAKVHPFTAVCTAYTFRNERPLAILMWVRSLTRAYSDENDIVGEAVKNDPLAYPPRGLSREEAARYIGVGITKFDQMVADRRMPKPKKVDGRVIWDRIKLEAAFADLPGDDDENIVDVLLQGNHRRE